MGQVKHAGTFAGSVPDRTADIVEDLDRIGSDLTDSYFLPSVLFDVYISTEASSSGAYASAAPVELEELRGVPNFQFHGKSRSCLITIYPSGMELYENAKASRAGAFSYDLAFLAHELYHCIQNTYFDDIAKQPGAPDWLVDGSALWAENKWIYDSTNTAYGVPLPGALSAEREHYWNRYLGQIQDARGESQVSLFPREYSAHGFFAHIENTGANPWRVIRSMIASLRLKPVSNDNDTRAFEAAVPDGRSARARFLQDWSMGLLRDPEHLGKQWDTTGPGITDYRAVPKTYNIDGTIAGLGVGPGDVQLISAPGAAERRRLLFANPDNAILLQSDAAYGAFVWFDASGRVVQTRFSPDPDTDYNRHAYCLDPKGCTCPDGLPVPVNPALEPAPVPELQEAVVGFTGGSRQGSIAFEIITAEDLCEPQEEQESETSAFDSCMGWTDGQVSKYVGQSMRNLALSNTGGTTVCLWGGTIYTKRTELLIGLDRRPLISTWEDFRDHAVAAGMDCAQRIVGLMACVQELDGGTTFYLWAGIRDALYVNLEAGADASASIKTPIGRRQVAEAIIQRLLR